MLDRQRPRDLVLQGAILGTSGDVLGIASTWPDGQTPTSYVDSTAPPIETDVYLPMNVTVEPDADGDQYGDLVRATDAAGNVDASPAKAKFKVTAPPN